MTELDGILNERCVACRRDSPRVTESESNELGQLIPDWRTAEVDGVPRLERTFKTKTYPQALEITQRIGELAELEGHHPVILVKARSVRVTWWTHAIRWLHRNDFIMAAKSDQIAAEVLGSAESSPGELGAPCTTS
jgi:4a-hydroxytetrahydrobiopterin dehydratase